MALDLKATLALDGSGFESGIHKATESLKGLALSAFGIYGVEQAIHKTIETATQLLETSNRLGIATEKFQEFAFAAKQSGLEVETLTKFIETLNKNRVDPTKQIHFQRLGIDNPSTGDITDVIYKLSAFVKLKGTQEISPDLIHAGGKSAGEAINFLNENLEELAKQAHDVGAVIKTDDLVSIKYLADQMEILSQVIIAQLAPALVHLMNQAIRLVNTLKADKTFYDKLTDSGKGLSNLGVMDFIMNPFIDILGNRSEASAKLKKFMDAGAGSESTLEELNDNSDAMLARLKKEQEERERRNLGGIVDPSADPVKKAREAHASQITTDSLLRVGNFLGTGNPLVQIGKTHTLLLQRIAHNTGKLPRGGRDPAFDFPHT